MIPIEQIRQMAKKKRYGFNQYKQTLGEPTKLVLVGEKHANYERYLFQSDLIALLKPEVVLHEFYEPKRTPSSSDSINAAIDWIDRWPTEYSVQLKPCDLPYQKIRQFERWVYGFLEELPEFADEQDIESILVDDNAIREMVMGKLIRTAVAKSNRPVIAIVGGGHVCPGSRIHQELRCRRAIEVGWRPPIGYITINQDDYLAGLLQEGAQFFE